MKQRLLYVSSKIHEIFSQSSAAQKWIAQQYIISMIEYLLVPVSVVLLRCLTTISFELGINFNYFFV